MEVYRTSDPLFGDIAPFLPPFLVNNGSYVRNNTKYEAFQVISVLHVRLS
ncbi:hypothetical protein [Paenibacillus sp. FSL K6-2524]